MVCQHQAFAAQSAAQGHVALGGGAARTRQGGRSLAGRKRLTGCKKQQGEQHRVPVIPCGDGSEMVCRTRLGDQGRIGPSRWTACWGPWTRSPWFSVPPSPAQPGPASPSPRPPCLCHPARRCGIPDGAGDGDRRRVEIALTWREGGCAGRRARAPANTRTPSLGSHAPCSSLPLGVSRSPGYNDAGVQTECLLDGRVSRRRCHRSAWAAGRGQCQRNVRGILAALSWVWMEPIIPIGNGRAQLPEVWQGDGPNEEAKWKQNATRRAAGRLVERLASIPSSPSSRHREGEGGREAGAHAEFGESGA